MRLSKDPAPQRRNDMERSALSWREPVGPVLLLGDEVHVWLASLQEWQVHIAALSQFLSREEMERAARFRFENGRTMYFVARALTRLLLSGYTGVAAAELLISYGPHGKPALANDGSLHFNVSHSGDFAALAFTRAGPVGVDIERVRADMQRQSDIAERHFAPGEVAQLNALPESDRNAGFFRCWSRKEAYIKARGDGIFGGLQTFEISLAKDHAQLVHSATAPVIGHSWMAALPIVPGYEAAVCVFASAAELICFRAHPTSFPYKDKFHQSSAKR